MRPKHILGLLFAAASTLACGTPTRPSEMPPLAPSPDPVDPVPMGGDDPGKLPDGTKPVPGAPDPIAPPGDAGVSALREVPTPAVAASGEFGAAPSDREELIPMQKVKKTPVDAAVGGGDAAAPLPPVPDALPTDASMTPPK